MSRPRSGIRRRTAAGGASVPAPPPPHAPACPPGAGFTLLEVTVALLVAGVAVLAGYSGLRSLADARRSAAAAHRSVLAPVNARVTLEGWLRSTTLLLESRDHADGGHPLNEIIFVVADAGSLRPGPHRVHLQVDLDPATPARGLVAELLPLGGGEPELVSFAPSATGLEIRYRVSRDGQLRWVSRWEPDKRLPDAVRLRLVETARIRLGPSGEDRPVAAGGPGPEERGKLPPLLRLPLIVPLEVKLW